MVHKQTPKSSQSVTVCMHMCIIVGTPGADGDPGAPGKDGLPGEDGESLMWGTLYSTQANNE